MLEMLATKLEAVDSQLNVLTSAPPKTLGESATKTVGDSSAASEGSGRNDVDGGSSVEAVERCNREYLKTLDEEQVKGSFG